MIVFTEKEIKKHIALDDASIAVIEDGFSKLITQNVAMPPIMRVDIPEHQGEVDVKTAYVPGRDHFAIKISSGFFENDKLGLPSGNGMMILIHAKTGVPAAVLADQGYLTDIRTAAAGAIASKYMAKKQVQTVGIIGTGSQARYQLQALTNVRSFTDVIVYGRNHKRVQTYINEVKSFCDATFTVADSIEEVVKASDIVVTTTPSTKPLIKSDWLHPGLHITAMGSDAEHKQELETGVFTYADHIVCDVKSQCLRLGELHHAFEKDLLTHTDKIIELGEVTSTGCSPRNNDNEITICDLTGTGVQDTMIAELAYQTLITRHAGTRLS
ncbi:cyclodeaminase [Desertibacillus haloalkaliphilus]|uniref:cyclodeaminase n=1 Tax=Desertibacillus haloalkaliphilus TaxID=1328930 RepID=UPI001C279DAE|nr:cyclodeaminase [Desertibacillus haloalkaliphilus]MBU8908031.1 cyclodeaminase [Desertibacillus haloalkaliphilus]